jgi:hypothetical protein
MGEDKQPPVSRLEEALHPQIGNGADWSHALHDSQLREIDPTKRLDPHLMDQEQASDIVRQWEADIRDPFPEVPVAPESEPKAEPLPAAREQEPDPVIEPASKAPAPGKKQSGKKVKAGKRVRKLAEQEEEKTAENQRKIRAQFAPASDESLTPFTQWLKGLKGSEYVHPFEDDFAFRQAGGPVREGISETYADLLAMQGYKDQAIDMYKRLMEKFPEKSLFFAAKIDALS